MARLPHGVTVNGRQIYYNGHDDRSLADTPGNIIRDIKPELHLKRQSIKGRAFSQERKKGKLQRVTETIIYDKKGIKKMELEKKREEFRKHIITGFETLPVAEIIIVVFGTYEGYKENKDIVKLLEEYGRGQNRTISKLTRSTLSFHLSEFWNNKKAITLFVTKKREKHYVYEMSEMGLRLGPALLATLRTVKIPDNLQSLRLRLSELRQLAKRRGISEQEFNDFIAKRFKELKQPIEGIGDKKPVTYTVNDMPLKPEPKKAKPKVKPKIERVEPVEPEQPLTESKYLKKLKEVDESKEVTEYSPERKFVERDEKILEMQGVIAEQLKVLTDSRSEATEKRDYKEIELNLKVWFIPVTGQIRIK